MENESSGAWRVYLTGMETDLARLRRELRSGSLVVAADASDTTYLLADTFTAMPTADDVAKEVPSALALLNGMAALSFGGQRPVGFGGVIARGRDRFIFVNETIRLSDEIGVLRVGVDITADGFVSDVSGQVKTDVGLSTMQRRLASLQTNPELEAVYRVLGLATPSWGSQLQGVRTARQSSRWGTTTATEDGRVARSD